MAKAFVETLREIRDGELINELSIQMRDLVEAVKTTNKRGKLTVTLTLSPSKGGVLLLEDDYKLNRPEPDKETTTVFYPTEENDLSRRDPRQPKLPAMEGPRGVVQTMSAERAGQSNG